MTKAPLEGGCACGAVRYRLMSDPLFVHCCHCLNCQRQTGSAFVVNVLIETDRLEILAGDPQPVAVPRAGGKKQKIWRCPTCQVAVFSQYSLRPDPLRPCRYARRSDSSRARRSYLHAVEAALGHASRLCARVRGLLRHEEVVARRQPRAPRRRSWHRQAPRPDLSTDHEPLLFSPTLASWSVASFGSQPCAEENPRSL